MVVLQNAPEPLATLDRPTGPAVGRQHGANAVGRSLAKGFDIDSKTVAAGRSWSFETLSFYVPVVDYVAYPDVTSCY